MRLRLSHIQGALAAMMLGSAALATGDEMSIVDTHLHYSQNSWQDQTPAAIVLLMDQAGISRAFVSSTPDDGTVRLFDLAPDRIVPVLRPYRQPGELSTWHQDPTIVPYLEQRLGRPIYRGIGEFHLSGSGAGSPVVRQVAELASRHGLFLHCHCDAAAAEILVGLVPGVRVLWAHAGMSFGAADVGRLVDAFPDLLVELALRSDVAPGGKLDPAWRDLFVRHADRFMVGTDTWVSSRWGSYIEVQNDTRTWLRQLPPEVARRLATENAESLARPPASAGSSARQ